MSASISIVIPTYNRATSVLKIIRQASDQLAISDELVVVDDASPDNTASQIPEVRGVRATRNQKNLGMVGNWNESLRQAKAEWVLTVHDDDDLHPQALQTLRRAIERADGKPCVIAGGHLGAFRDDPERYLYSAPGTWAVLNAPAIPSGIAIHRSLMEEGVFDAAFSYSSDLELFPRYAKTFPTLWVESPTLVRYNMHGDNLQYSTWKKPDFVEQLDLLVRKVGTYAGLSGADLNRYVDEKMGGYIAHVMRHSYRNGERKLFRDYSKLLRGRSGLGRRMRLASFIGSKTGWCPRGLIQ